MTIDALATSQAFWCVVWGFVLWTGMCVGSFLNVCIYRMPREMSVVMPPSHCTKCDRRIRWYENIPVLSFAFLGGRCKGCQTRIGWRYPAVELLTGFTAVATFAHYGMNAVAAVYFVLFCALITISFIDLDFKIIPDEISVGGIGVGMLLSLLVPELHGTEHRWLALGHSVSGVLLGGGTLYLTAILGDWLFRRESMGGGDIKLLAMAGSILGWKPVLMTYFFAPFFAMVPGLIQMIRKRNSEIPYGPFLAVAMVVAMVWGEQILEVVGITETIRLLRMHYLGS